MGNAGVSTALEEKRVEASNVQVAQSAVNQALDCLKKHQRTGLGGKLH